MAGARTDGDAEDSSGRAPGLGGGITITELWWESLTLESPCVLALGLALAKSACAKLSPIIVGQAHHDAYVQGFARWVCVWGVPGQLGPLVGNTFRWALAAVELACIFKLATFQAYDGRMLACAAAGMLHLALLCSLILDAADENSGFLCVGKDCSESVDTVSTLVLDSVLIEMLAGSLVLFGLKQSIPFEVREGNSDAECTSASAAEPKVTEVSADINSDPERDETKRKSAGHRKRLIPTQALALVYTIVILSTAVSTASGSHYMPCDGLFCGRTVHGNGTVSNCGACPRGHRSNDINSICTECTDPITRYSGLYLATQVGLILGLQVWGARKTVKHVGSMYVIGSQIVEVALACVIASLLMKPVGELRMYGCPVRSVDDWYTWFNNPTAPCSPMDCANEAVYPLMTWVLVVDAVNAVVAVVIRLPLTRLRRATAAGVDSMFSSLYILPLHAASTVVLGGVLYYSYPYLLVLSGALALTLWMCSSDERLITRFRNRESLGSVLLGYVLIAFGVAAFISYFRADPDNVLFYSTPFLTPFCLIIIYALTIRITEPDQVMAQLMIVGRRMTR